MERIYETGPKAMTLLRADAVKEILPAIEKMLRNCPECEGEDADSVYECNHCGETRKLLPALRALLEAKREPVASSECPICRADYPHKHSQTEVLHWVDAQASRFGHRVTDLVPHIPFATQYIVVPVEPTEKMLAAACRWFDKTSWLNGWRDAIKAAPEVPVASPTLADAGWIKCSERMPPDYETVLVYSPPKDGESERIDFDWREEDAWACHFSSYEHFMAVGGSRAAGPDATCVGPDEEAPYTHWRELPAAPILGEKP